MRKIKSRKIISSPHACAWDDQPLALSPISKIHTAGASNPSDGRVQLLRD
jgi:hypothetical protein